MLLTFLCIVYDVGQWIVMIDNRNRECSFLLPIKPVSLYVSLYGIISIFSCWVADYLVVRDGEGRHWDCSQDHFASDLNVEWGERLSDHLVLNEEILFWTFSSLWLSKLCELCDCDQDKFTSWFLKQKGRKPRQACLFLSANSGAGCEPDLLVRLSPECNRSSANKTNGW